MISLRLKKDKRKTRKNFTVRLSKEEYNNILQKAMVHTDGNVGEFIRFAAQNYRVRKKDLEKI